MRAIVHNSADKLITMKKIWFKYSNEPAEQIKSIVNASINGIYCLWWEDINTFPESSSVELPAGKREKILVTVKPCLSEFTDVIALYVGKGDVRKRLISHLKTSKSKTRNPYTWLESMFPDQDLNPLIRNNMGFSFIEEPNKLEQIYIENLAIGLLKPIFNARLTA